MNIKISINMKILSMLNEFEHAEAENKSQLRQDLLQELVSLAKIYPIQLQVKPTNGGKCSLKLQGVT